jgi:CspA family cold shock protein
VLGFSFFSYFNEEKYMKGTVKFFNGSKGYGFITAEGGEDIFFHQSNVKETGFRDTLKQGDLVTFEIQNGQKGKRAVNIART